MSYEKKVLLTGAQPTGDFTLGNFLGAIRNWVKLQDELECYFFLADLHAMVVPYVPAELRQNTLKALAQYLACGLDPDKACIFAQSSVSGHTDLAWILGCLTPVGQLFRMTQFKAKSDDKDFIGSGLLYYPVLMAADILLYNAHLVAVGEDQKQHLELTRDLAIKFNQTYSKTFNIPEPYTLKSGGRIYSLQAPTQKMSKSDPNKKGTIFLFESPESIRKKFQSAVTDSGAGIYCSSEKPGISNLINILSAITDTTTEKIESEYDHYPYADFKNIVTDAVIEKLKPFQNNYQSWLNNKDALSQILQKSSELASKRAQKMLRKVYKKTGLVQMS